MELEDHIFFLCTQVVYRRDRAIHAALKPLGLLATEWRTLGTVLRKGPIAMLDLAQWTAYERTRLTRILHSMEERGWIERTGADHDGRSVMVQISTAGKKIYRQAEVAVDALTDEILGASSPAEVTRVRKALQAMRGKLIAMGH
jgi:MarR family transcriptional regulator for hemolysin